MSDKMHFFVLMDSWLRCALHVWSGHLEALGELGHDVLARVHHHGGGEREGGLGPAQLKLGGAVARRRSSDEEEY